MNAKIKTLHPDQFLREFMISGSKRNEIFKKDFGDFYIARMEELTEISKPPFPPVRAETHTIFFLTKGALEIKVGFNHVLARKNQSVVIPAGQVFSHNCENKELTTGFICGFSNDFLLELLENQELLNRFEFLTVWGNPILQPSEKIAQFIVQSLQRILYEYSQNGLKNKLILKSYLIATLFDLNTNYQPLSRSNNRAATELTNKFIGLLHQNLRSIHKVSEYASLLHVTPNHLNKCVKMITGNSPSYWISSSLILEAKALLYQSEQTIGEISLDIGLEDPSYFSRLFKKHEGMTPADYRNMIELS